VLAFAPAIGVAACGGSNPSSLYAMGDDAAGTGGDSAPPQEAAPAEDTGSGMTLDTGVDSTVIVDSGSIPDVAPVPESSPVETGPAPYSIACGMMTTCTAPAQFCCASGPTGMQTQTCVATLGDCGGNQDTPVYCTSSTQCAAGEVCCGNLNSAVYGAISCQSDDGGAGGPCSAANAYVFCDPSVPSDCPQGMSCTLSTRLDGFYRCN
jgi:hypothetical protein